MAAMVGELTLEPGSPHAGLCIDTVEALMDPSQPFYKPYPVGVEPGNQGKGDGQDGDGGGDGDGDPWWREKLDFADWIDGGSLSHTC